MKRKSIPGFIVGLIGLFIGIPIGYYAFWIISLIMALSGMDILVYSTYLIPIAGVLTLIALCFYFNKAKIGGLIMLISSILYIVPFVLALTVKGINIGELILQLILGLLPAVLTIISTVLAFKSKNNNVIE